MRKKVDFGKAAVAAYDQKKKLFLVLILIEVLVLLSVFIFTSGVYAADEYWHIKVGDKVIATVRSKGEAKKAIKHVEKHYTEKNASDVEIEMDPVITVEEQFYGDNQEPPEAVDAKKAAKKILKAKKNYGYGLLLRLSRVLPGLVRVGFLLLARGQHQCRAKDQDQAKDSLLHHGYSLRFICVPRFLIPRRPYISDGIFSGPG